MHMRKYGVVFWLNTIALSTLAHAEFIGTSWLDLNPQDVEKKADGTGAAVIGREITLTDTTILNLTAVANPVLEQQYYQGDLKFENIKSLTLNINVQSVDNSGLTPVYWFQTNDPRRIVNSFTCGKYQDSDGTCVMNVNIDSTQIPLKHLFYMEASTFLLSPRVNVEIKENSQIHSVFAVGTHKMAQATGTLEFFGGLSVDLRKSVGKFEDARIGERRKLIFENFGAAINVNPDKRPFSVKLYGDIFTEGLGTRINLVTPDSIFEGHIDIGDANFNSITEFTLQNGATANIKLNYLTPINANLQSFGLSLSDSTASLEATLGQTQNATTKFELTRSTLYANFDYASPNRNAQDNMEISLVQSTWITNKNAYADSINFGSGGVVDLRYSDFFGNLREYQQMSEANQIKITSKKISGGGTFRLYGILNRALWQKDAQGNSIATDQIITDTLSGNAYLQIYWDPKSLDETLLSEELVGDRIVVARQNSRDNNGEFIGASTPIGLFEYTTKLSKEDVLDAGGRPVGYEWVIGSFDKGSLSSSARPSLLSRALKSSLNIPYKTWLAQTQTLHERMGDLRRFDSIAGPYIKNSYSLFYSQETQEEISSLTNTFEVTLGGDYGFFTQGGKSFVGLALSITPMWDFGDNGAYEGSSVAYGVSAYESFLFDNGLYMDFLLKYIYANHTYNYFSADLNGNTLNLDTHAFLGSYEIGYRFRLTPQEKNFYYVKPQVNLNFGYLFGVDSIALMHTAGYEVNAQMIGSFPLQTAIGVDFGRRFDREDLLGDVFITFGGEYTFNAGNTLKLATSVNSAEFVPENIFNLKLAVGGNVIWEKVRVYFELSSKFIGRIAPVLSMNAGVRVPLGGNHPRLSTPKVHFPVIYGSRRRD